MPALSQQYVREMNERFGYQATWLPNTQLRLGDVGVVRDRVFEPVTSLERLGIAFTVDRPGKAADLDYTSSDAVSIEAGAAAAAPGLAPAVGPAAGSVRISFKRANAVVFQATGCVTSTIANVQAVGEEILARYNKYEWDPDHLVITDLVTATGATILISNGQDAHIDLALDVQAGGGLAKLADANAKVSVTRATGIGTRIVAARGLTPLFKVAGVKPRLFARDQFARREAADVQFRELDYKELS